MQAFTSKELYMMNGGNKLYIYKDGFGDVYNATPAEEAEWAVEVVENALNRLEPETNTTVLKLLVESLSFHKYEGLESLLIEKIKHTTPSKQIAFAASLWNISKYEKSFGIIKQNLLQHRAECVNDAFWALNDLKKNAEAKQFIVECLEGDDEELSAKAQMTITMWSYSGIPQLRQNNLSELLKPENKNSVTFKPAIEELKKILFTWRK